MQVMKYQKKAGENRVESIEAIDLRDSQSQINADGGSTVFNDILNISWDALQRMSWDSRTWTIRGDDTDTVIAWP